MLNDIKRTWKILERRAKGYFEKLMDNMSELERLSERAMFICEFKYGARVTDEALISSNTPKNK